MTKRRAHSNSRHQSENKPHGARKHPNSASSRSNDNYKGNRSGNPANSPLPDPTILQEYEYATDGAAGRILEMAEIEQDRRNQWEDEYLHFYKKSLRIGQLFGFLLLIVIVLAVVYLSEQGKDQVAQVLAGSAFISVAISSIFANINKSKSPRRPRRPRREK